MQFRKPIISTYTIENEPAIAYLSEYGGSFFLDERPESDFNRINSELADFVTGRKPVEEKDYTNIYYLNTPQAFIDTLKSKS